MQELDVTWIRAIKVWWSMVWRVIAVSILAGIAISVVVGFIAGIFGYKEGVQVITQLLGIITGIPIGVWAVKVVLGMEYADFRVALLPSSEALLEQQLAKQKTDS
ncbi:MAG TPA: hypothetical protein VLN56_08060 [Gammaproteobacteria bacterium]|nr:hypothetical protein [Gammaproteobacteria bacterium]